MTRRAGLGRGLEALLPSGDAPAQGGPAEVAVTAIRPNPRQPRRAFDDGTLEELAASITQLGILQPLLVRSLGDGGYELVAGERRLRAAERAGVESVPVVVVDADARGSLERALVENLHREDLNPIEEAAGYRQLLDEGGLTQEQLAARLGRSRVTISNALRLLELPVGVQRLLIEARLSAGHGKALLGLGGSPFMERLARRSAQEGLSVRETEELVRRYQSMSAGSEEAGKGGRAARPPLAAEAQRRLADHLQTRVRVEVGKRKGRVVIDFVSLEELSRIADAILGDSGGSDTTVVIPE
ncbi:MAG: ParB/RepB/Spo0J family partition protein [Actinomycetota bacterium]